MVVFIPAGGWGDRDGAAKYFYPFGNFFQILLSKLGNAPDGKSSQKNTVFIAPLMESDQKSVQNLLKKSVQKLLKTTKLVHSCWLTLLANVYI